MYNEIGIFVGRGEVTLESVRTRKGMQSRNYLKKMIFTYSTVVYMAVLLTGLLFLAYIQRNNVMSEISRQDAYFTSCVDVYEGVLEDFISITSDLKEMNKLDLFALSGETSYYQKMTEFQQELERFTTPYRRQGFGFAIQRGDEELIVTDTKSTKEKYLLQEWKITEQQFAAAKYALMYANKRDYLIFTDNHIFYITAKSYMSRNVYIICYLPVTSIVMPRYDDNTVINFWSQDSGIQDLRNQNELQALHEDVLFAMGQDAIYRYQSGNAMYRLQSSNYYDIVYCGITKGIYTEIAMRVILVILCVMIPIYGVVYLITKQISCHVYQPIEELTNTVRGISGSDSPAGNELSFIADKVRSMQSQNDELQKRLDSLTADIQQGIQTKSILEEERESDILKEQLEEYILEHLSEDISLCDLADYFGLSFHYMSVVFKNKVDYNFKEYLSYQRYVRALAIMQENPKMKITDIASQVGINNVNTFIRIFKKYNGTTPKQYMNTLF